MSRPYLIIYAGCNGSGKSTFSTSLAKNFTPFDYDKRFIEIYNSLPDSEFREAFAKNQTTAEFEEFIESSIDKRQNFGYETNFDQHPLHWASLAKEAGYDLELHFFCLQSLAQAKKRVDFRARVERKHPVLHSIIEYKWKEGYKNLNLYYSFFDRILVFDNSSKMSSPKVVFGLFKNRDGSFDVERYEKEIPIYAKRRFPDIYKILNSKI